MTLEEREGLIVAIHLMGFRLYHPPKVREFNRYQLVGAPVEMRHGQTMYKGVSKWITGEVSPRVVPVSWSNRWRPVNWRHVPDADVVAFFKAITGG